MFGYVTINKPEIRFKDYDMYRSYYCGLCRDLGERYGFSGRMTLGYDMTFLIILLTGLYDTDTAERMKRCILHPLRKHRERSNEFTEYAADMNLLLFYHKCCDDWQDERKWTRRIYAALISGRVKRIERKYPEKAELIKTLLNELSAAEQEAAEPDRNDAANEDINDAADAADTAAPNKNYAADTAAPNKNYAANAAGADRNDAAGAAHTYRNGAVQDYDRLKEERVWTKLDETAGLFGRILAEIFAYRRDMWEETLRRVGFYLGKFIYLMDAYDDIEEDRAEKRYNPFLEFYGMDGFDEKCAGAMKMMIAECADSFERLPVVDHMEILRNILYAGVWNQFEMTLQKRKEKKNV